MKELNLRYPIGQFTKPENIEKSLLDNWIEIIGSFPSVLNNTLEAISENQLDMPYRKDGWTVRQVVHHCADSHMNAFSSLP
ncbi:DinB family protein [Mariniflexile gromovii]|uniref:DinB family protein n=1 Tax=Mariniflexile gromovii TaxID=362523 RepID=UPI001FD8379C|nr:DinB family protein [Mariniflexile gromovii]